MSLTGNYVRGISANMFLVINKTFFIRGEYNGICSMPLLPLE